MEIRVVNLKERFAQITDCWNPRIVSEVNNTAIKLTKLNGEFVWHHHEQEDEMFLVISGELRMKVRSEAGAEKEFRINPGEFITIPHGVEHLPIADGEVHIVLIEPKDTLNTGNLRSERTRTELERI
jgi:mannose-6-phosphate isomerase-like protein (cupin superfamily)